MPKRSKPIESIIERYSNEEDVLIASTAFIYEVDIFVNTLTSYYLIDSKVAKTTKKKLELITYERIKGSYVRQVYKLIAAPKEWLKENKYTFII